jgi:hypothetical protein
MLCISETFATSPAVRVEAKPARAGAPFDVENNETSGTRGARSAPRCAVNVHAGQDACGDVVARIGPAASKRGRASVLSMATNDAALDIALDRMIDAIMRGGR